MSPVVHAVPLSARVVERTNVMWVNGALTRVMVVGEIHLTMLAAGPTSGRARIKITHADQLEKVAAHPDVLAEVAGALITGSLALLVDAAHMLTDAGGLLMALLASTLMACTDSALMALDQEVGKRLEGTLKLAATQDDAARLTLTTATGDTLVFTGDPTAETRYGGPGERVFLEVAAETKPCSHPLIPDKQCLQVREIQYDDKGLKVGTPGAFEHFYDSIEGYTHEPGIRNVLRVDRYTVKNPPADASSSAYVLDMVVESANEKK